MEPRKNILQRILQASALALATFAIVGAWSPTALAHNTGDPCDVPASENPQALSWSCVEKCIERGQAYLDNGGVWTINDYQVQNAREGCCIHFELLGYENVCEDLGVPIPFEVAKEVGIDPSGLIFGILEPTEVFEGIHPHYDGLASNVGEAWGFTSHPTDLVAPSDFCADAFTVNVAGLAYVETRGTDGGVWIYLEDNGQPGPQRGGVSLLGEPDNCQDGAAPDTLLV